MPRCAAEAKSSVQRPITEAMAVWYFSDESLQYIKAFLMELWSP